MHFKSPFANHKICLIIFRAVSMSGLGCEALGVGTLYSLLF
jgi:hypothetical protein